MDRNRIHGDTYRHTLLQEVINFHEYTWWQTFLENPTSVLPVSRTRWELDFLRPYKRVETPAPTLTEEGAGVIQELMNKERFGKDVSNY